MFKVSKFYIVLRDLVIVLMFIPVHLSQCNQVSKFLSLKWFCYNFFTILQLVNADFKNIIIFETYGLGARFLMQNSVKF
jgi:hypothetical protein